MAGGAGHAGDVSPKKAAEILNATPGAVLIDVRTEPEWENVGIPDPNALPVKPVFLEWLLPPAMAPNPDFTDRLKTELASRGADRTTPLLFLCRSGARSAAAAAAVTGLGFEQCHNIEGGFEGSPGLGLPGWKQSGLPWISR